MRGGGDFDARFAARRRRVDRFARLNMLVGCGVLLIGFLVVAWCLFHPHAIGSFLGRFAAGFTQAAG